MADTNGLAPSKDLRKQLNLVYSVQGHQAMWCDRVWVPRSFCHALTESFWDAQWSRTQVTSMYPMQDCASGCDSNGI